MSNKVQENKDRMFKNYQAKGGMKLSHHQTSFGLL